MQRSSFEDIQTFLKTEGWKLRFQSTSEITSGFGFKKAVFTKSDVEKIAVYTSKSYGSIIQLELSNSCFKTISVSEFGQADRKLLVENDKSIKEYRNANQIIQLQEYDEGSATNPQILIFNEDLDQNELNKIKKIVVQAKFDTPNPLTGWNEAQSIPFGAFLAVKLRLKLNAEIVY